MEFESGSEGIELRLDSRQGQIAQRQEERGDMRSAEVLVWSQAWLEAAKTAAMGVGVNMGQFVQHQGGLWTRDQAEAWLEAEWAVAMARVEAEMWAKAKALAESKEGGVNVAAVWPSGTWMLLEATKKVLSQTFVNAKATAEAEALAGVWAWAVQKGERPLSSMPSGSAGSSRIRGILTSLNRYGVANDLWYSSPETRDEYSYIIHFTAPITRLPFELLLQIFLIIIDETHGPPSALMLVCKHWHDIVTSIWGSLNLSTTTPIDAVTSTLRRSQWLLDIVVDTNSDRGDFTPSYSAYKAIFAAIEATPRWRSLVIESFPARADLPEDLVNRRFQQCSNATMSRFTTFRIKSACETSPLLDGLLRVLGATAGSELTTVEISSGNVISFLVPLYPSLFHSVKVLSLDTHGIRDPVDLLPHLHQLESFTASYLPLPTFYGHVDLPFVHTLRHLRLKSVSIQWMSGRTFHVLENCTLIFPLHRQVLPAFNTTLPSCNHLTFQGYPLEILGGVSAQNLSHLSVICSGSFNRRGSRQLVWLSPRVSRESRLAPKILHISIKATDEAWIRSLALMSDLEELVIHNAQPSSLGAKVFQSLVVQPVHASHPSVTTTPGDSGAPFCPSLRRFGLKYDRWLRPSERFDLSPVFVSIIQSRQYSNRSLKNFDLWTTNDQKDPLELIEESVISIKGFKRLAKESGIEEDLLDLTVMGLIQGTPKPAAAPVPANQGGVIPQMIGGAGVAKQTFRNQKLVADIDAMPLDEALNRLIGRILTADWFHYNEREPTYSRVVYLGLLTPALGLKLRDGQSIFLAFQDDAQRCVFCAHQNAKPNRMVRHMRVHFGLRPYECQLPSCFSCRDG